MQNPEAIGWQTNKFNHLNVFKTLHGKKILLESQKKVTHWENG